MRRSTRLFIHITASLVGTLAAVLALRMDWPALGITNIIMATLNAAFALVLIGDRR